MTDDPVDEITREVFRRLSEQLRQLAQLPEMPLRKAELHVDEPPAAVPADERRARFRRDLIQKIRGAR